MSLSTVNKDDLQKDVVTVVISEEGRIKDDELLAFVGVYFSNDHTIGSNETLPELNRKGCYHLWIFCLLFIN